MTIETYFTMNARIVAILRQGSDPMALYAAQRIEELEQIAGIRGKCLSIAVGALQNHAHLDILKVQGIMAEIKRRMAELGPEESTQ
jgi:hypothetical protein